MTTGFPRWFRTLFVAVMLALCTVLVTQIIHHQDLSAQITTLQGQIDTARKRMVRQVRELEEYTAELPLVQAELEVAGPAAEAAAARVASLKAQRRALQDAIAAQEARIAELQAQLDALPDPADTVQQVDAVLTTLTDAQSNPPR